MLYFLAKYTLTNEDGIHIGINYSLMSNELAFSKTLGRRLVHLYQTEISSVSCQFIQFLAKDLCDLYPEYHSILDHLILKDDDGRTVIACFVSLDILLKHMIANQANLTLNIYPNRFGRWIENERVNLHFNVYENKLTPCLEHTFNKAPSVVFRGITHISPQQLTHQLVYFGIQKTLLASTARHPQYPGKQLAEFKENPFSRALDEATTYSKKSFLQALQKEFLSLKEWALQVGCCMENPETFFVTHIFCDQFNNYSELMSYDRGIPPFSKLKGNDREKYTERNRFIH